MLTPIFAHGTYENSIRAIDEGKLIYPAYLWISDLKQYGFLNKNNELELIGIPEYTGTLENTLILSTFEDGLYQVKGQYKITANHETTFSSFSPIIVVVQTIDGYKTIRRITADELTTYTIGENLSVTVNEVATKDYLDDHHYATEEYVNLQVATMEQLLLETLPDIIETKIDEMIQSIDNDDIRDLFN